MNMQQVARGWYVYEITESALDLAWVTLSFMLPHVLLSLPGGVVADRNPKRRIMVTALLLNGLAALSMGLLVFFEVVDFIHFIVVGVLSGSVLALSVPARYAIVPELVNRRAVFSAIALNSTAMNVARVVGPALAGFLIAWIAGGDTSSSIGVATVYFVIASLYVLASFLTSSITIAGEPIPRRTSTRVGEDMVEGLRFVARHPSVFGLVLLSIVPFLFGYVLNTFLPAYNESVLNGGAEDLGLLLSALGIGAILGSLALATATNLQRKGAWLIAMLITWGLALLAFGFVTSSLVAMFLMALVGWLSSSNMAMNRALIQTHVSSRMLGRVMSIDMMSHGLMPLGALPLGLLADTHGVSIAISTSGALQVVVVLLLVAVSPAIRHISKP